MNSRASRLVAIAGVALLLAAGISSAASPSVVKVLSLTPAAGSTVQSDTVLKAEVEYEIQVFEPKTTHYVLVPMFATTDGRGTFNHLQRAMDGKVLREQSGTVKITYPIRQELADSRLAKPIQCIFTLMHIKGGTILPVVSSNPIAYEVK